MARFVAASQHPTVARRRDHCRVGPRLRFLAAELVYLCRAARSKAPVFARARCGPGRDMPTLADYMRVAAIQRLDEAAIVKRARPIAPSLAPNMRSQAIRGIG